EAEEPLEEEEEPAEAEEPLEEEEEPAEAEEPPEDEEEPAEEPAVSGGGPVAAPEGDAGADGEQEEGAKPSETDRIAQARMLAYLITLTGDLPEEKRRSFSESDVPLRIAAVQSKLLGQQGLRRDVARYDMSGRRGHALVTTKRLADTFSFVAKMARYHPDSTIGSALRDRVKRILSRLEAYRSGRDGR
ncbi:MAG: hypothetical protein ACOCYC_04825, partial [bacterium]